MENRWLRIPLRLQYGKIHDYDYDYDYTSYVIVDYKYDYDYTCKNDDYDYDDDYDYTSHTIYDKEKLLNIWYHHYLYQTSHLNWVFKCQHWIRLGNA